ncbi:Glu-tRNA(Gln) amidotransferase subunit GatE [Candidatus Woesearchaeota archaeon]|nr:Glu-tRNA(Gln) amidotransferase subunit GatE [Candidatus Woesearchaeota archaeon]
MNIPKLKTEITDADVNELKLTCGLEIHQQLEGKKLFCNCPTTIRDDKEDFLIKRYLRASAGEGGKIDAAALAEIKKQKHFFYEGYKDTTCLVELDEEPPGPVNNDALNAALQVSKFIGANIIDEIRFMRKTVVDGSNTGGFQRTGLVSVGGQLQTELRTQNSERSLLVGVESVCIEEDSCKKIETKSESEKYNLSRLGIPLIELATAPDIHHPDDVELVAGHIGMIMRSLDNVKRGLGTIRQDVNVSILDGLRVEIKGAQDLKMLGTLARNEMLRQHNLLLIFEELKNRGASVGEDLINVTDIFVTSQSKVIQGALSKKSGIVLALPLYKFKGITSLVIQTGRRYGSELSDYAKMMGVKGLFHADELPNYGLTEEDKQSVYQKLNLNPDIDNFLLIADDEILARRALIAAKERVSSFELKKEVRVARPDGSSSYMRPMPGAARMYPETDVKPIKIDKEKIKPIKLLSEKITELSNEFGIAEDIAKRLIRDGINLFDLTNKYPNLKPASMIDVYYSTPSLMKKQFGLEVDIIPFAEKLFEKLNSNLITKESILEILLKLVKGEQINYSHYKPLNIEDIKDDVRKIVEENKDAPRGAIIGKVMASYKGKVDGKELSELINSFF